MDDCIAPAQRLLITEFRACNTLARHAHLECLTYDSEPAYCGARPLHLPMGAAPVFPLRNDPYGIFDAIAIAARPREVAIALAVTSPALGLGFGSVFRLESGLGGGASVNYY